MTITVRTARDVTREQIENFLFHEADLLDEWRLDEWLALFTEDGGYYIPSTDTPKAQPHDTLYLVADDNDRQVAPLGRNNTRRGRTLESERRANSEHPVTDGQARRIADRRLTQIGGVDF